MAHWYDLYFGWFYIVLGASFFLQPGQWVVLARRIIDEPQQVQVWWILFLGAGLWIIALHNIWVWQWHVSITVLGWALVLKSTIYLVFPKFLNYVSTWSDQAMHVTLRISGLIMTLVGLFLIW